MSWTAPKTDWANGDIVGDADLNRIEGNLAETGPARVQAAGDLIVAAGAHTLQRLPIGQNGQVLMVSGGTAAWGSVGADQDEYLVMLGLW